MEPSDYVAPARMTTLHLAILMHCNTINLPYGFHDVPHGVSTATLEYTQQLVDRGLIERDVNWNNKVPHPALKKYTATDKGRKLCRRILAYASEGAPPLLVQPDSTKKPIKEPRLRDECTFYEFFSTLKLPGWIWLLLGVAVMWRW